MEHGGEKEIPRQASHCKEGGKKLKHGKEFQTRSSAAKGEPRPIPRRKKQFANYIVSCSQTGHAAPKEP